MFSVQYETDLQNWRRARPEFRKFAAGVKAGLPDDELKELAAEAGEKPNTVYEMKSLRHSALRLVAEAKTFAEKQKVAAAIEKEWVPLCEALGTATNQNARDAIEQKVYVLGIARDKARTAAAESEVAGNLVRAATELGVLQHESFPGEIVPAAAMGLVPYSRRG